MVACCLSDICDTLEVKPHTTIKNLVHFNGSVLFERFFLSNDTLPLNWQKTHGALREFFRGGRFNGSVLDERYLRCLHASPRYRAPGPGVGRMR